MLRAMASDATPFFDDIRERAAGWLAAWDGQGIHRTATAGDNAGAEWLAREAAALGAAVAIEEFALDRLDPVAAFLEIDGERIDAVPVFDAPRPGWSARAVAPRALAAMWSLRSPVPIAGTRRSS